MTIVQDVGVRLPIKDDDLLPELDDLEKESEALRKAQEAKIHNLEANMAAVREAHELQLRIKQCENDYVRDDLVKRIHLLERENGALRAAVKARDERAQCLQSALSRKAKEEAIITHREVADLKGRIAQMRDKHAEELKRCVDKVEKKEAENERGKRTVDFYPCLVCFCLMETLRATMLVNEKEIARLRQQIRRLELETLVSSSANKRLQDKVDEYQSRIDMRCTAEEYAEKQLRGDDSLNYKVKWAIQHDNDLRTEMARTIRKADRATEAQAAARLDHILDDRTVNNFYHNLSKPFHCYHGKKVVLCPRLIPTRVQWVLVLSFVEKQHPNQYAWKDKEGEIHHSSWDYNWASIGL
ncbi:hypothetical protein HK104_009891 [Borealophlyctis nickersoniae]|nr:hypothetical protein HK104_009891 [Borealophlyctis nickersoniae]